MNLNRSPLDAMRIIAGDDARRYNGSPLQRSRIIARLMQGPASRAELERVTGAPSVTKRISELRRLGFEIVSGWAPMAGPGGTVSLCTVYALAERDDTQRDLFEDGRA